MDVLDTIGVDEVISVINDLEFPHEVVTDDGGDPAIPFKPFGNVTSQVLFYCLTKRHGQQPSVQS